MAKHFQNAVSDNEKASPVFVLSTYLVLPDIEVNPSVEEIQKMLSTAGQIILSVNKGVTRWKSLEDNYEDKSKEVSLVTTSTSQRKLYVAEKIEPDLIPEKQNSFYKLVSENKDIVKCVQYYRSCDQLAARVSSELRDSDWPKRAHCLLLDNLSITYNLFPRNTKLTFMKIFTVNMFS